VQIELKDRDSLFDRDAPPTYPHAGPMLNRAVGKFLLDSVREDRRKQNIEVTIVLRASPLSPVEEATARKQVKDYFAVEAELAALERRVNATEGWGSLRYALPVVIAAAIVAGLFTNPSTLGGPAYLTTLAYLIVLVVIWVMLWDPIEKLLFDSYFIRLRIYALHKLVRAKFTFVYPSGPTT
jgi:hypothetical protein